MNELKKLLIEINEVKELYDKERGKNRFNIFTALHKEHDEVNLHSRFISYLLSPLSGHGFDNKFAEIFCREILKLNQDDFNLSDYEVIPNEFIKSEYKEIDILIINKTTKQAIIIENKIFAKDSNREAEKRKCDGYDGQLERYYRTIKTGIDKDGTYNFDYHCEKVFIYYLTMFKIKQPSLDSIGNLSNEIKVIYYENEIRNWLEKCISLVGGRKSFFEEYVKQYLNVINKMTNNDISIEERTVLKKNIAENWGSTKYLIDNFKHIKWHTVHEFWTLLAKQLINHYQNVLLYPENFEKTISEITHSNKNTNHGIIFDISNGKKAYISGENILSWGTIEPKQWTYFKHELLENISFSTFITENTYRLISEKNMDNAVEIILTEISAEIKNNFKNMRKT